MRYVWISALLALAIAAGVYLVFSSETAISGVEQWGQIDPVDSFENTSASTLSIGDGNPQPPAYTGIPERSKMVDESMAAVLPERASAPYSATERAMLSNGMVNETAIKVLQSKQFDRLLTRLEIEQGGMTAELTAAYRAELEKLLGSVAMPKQIDRLVCGTDLCIASIRSPDRGWYAAWFEGAQSRSSLPMFTLTGNTIDLGGGGVEYRLLFSTSDSVKGFTGSAPRS